MKFDVDKLRSSSRAMNEKELQAMEFRAKNREWLVMSERLALRIRHLLREAGISQTEFASKMRVSPAQVTKILSGKENLGLKTICKIENALGTSIIEITDKVSAEECNELMVTC
jgi:ribosome-binding protein aMBF1 (putative translation factor)